MNIEMESVLLKIWLSERSLFNKLSLETYISISPSSSLLHLC